MSYDFSKFKSELQGVEEWLKGEFAKIRTGTATPSILDGITVESYGTKMPINQVASITTEGPKTLRVVPWDTSQLKAIEKAVLSSDLGLSVNLDDSGARISFPDLSAERRESLIKLARQKLEDAKVSLRTEREKVWDDLQKKEKDGEVTEDDKFRFKKEMEKIVDEFGKKLEEMVERKEKEILS